MSDNDLFTILETPESITITFSSSMKNIDRTCNEAMRFIADWFESVNYSNEFKNNIFPIQLVMREGLTNAVRHGNRLDTCKTVKCCIRMTQNRLIHMEIEDEGEGFDWKKKRPKDIGIDETSEHGRGLLIIDKYFSKYWYNKVGNKLFLEKHIHLK